MEKKNIVITVLVIALVGSGVGNIYLVILGGFVELVPPPDVIFIRATSAGPATLELTDSWDSASNDVLEQVVENLFSYDLFDTSLPRINLLAESYYWQSPTVLQIKLKEGIMFHDDTAFDATVAKWNLDRLLYLTNCTGTNTGEVAHTQSLWMFPDGVTPIIDNVATVGDWNITITLNGPFAPFLDLLCYINAGMVSPDSTPETKFIDLITGELVGTGPFTYVEYIVGVEVVFKRWDNYWRTPANFTTMKYVVFSDATTAHNAFLAFRVDYLAVTRVANFPTYEAEPKIRLQKFTEDTGISSLVYQYLGFNNLAFNKTWRKVMSFAVDYTYVLDEMLTSGGISLAIRANSPISPGWGSAYNESAKAATFDIPRARLLMQSMGFGIDFTEDQDWINRADGASPFLTANFSYNIGNAFREDLFVAVQDWYKLVGIKVTDNGVTWALYLDLLFDTPEKLGLYAIGWAPDYLEPFNMLDPLFNPISDSNSAGVNDAWLNAQMTLALTTTDDTARDNIYKSIQWYMAEVGYFHAYLYHSRVTAVYLSNIYSVPVNAMGSWQAYPIYRGDYPS